MFRWQEGHLHTWPTETQFGGGAYSQQKVYLTEGASGLLQVSEDSLEQVLTADLIGDEPILKNVPDPTNAKRQLLLFWQGELGWLTANKRVSPFDCDPEIIRLLEADWPSRPLQEPF